MYQEISLRLSDGSEQNFPFLATGTTAYRFKQVFHQDLMILLNKMENSEDDQTDMTVGDKLAFIMNAQAEKKDMNHHKYYKLHLFLHTKEAHLQGHMPSLHFFD